MIKNSYPNPPNPAKSLPTEYVSPFSTQLLLKIWTDSMRGLGAIELLCSDCGYQIYARVNTRRLVHQKKIEVKFT